MSVQPIFCGVCICDNNVTICVFSVDADVVDVDMSREQSDDVGGS